MSALSPIEWTDRTWNPLAAFLTRDLTVMAGGKPKLIPAGTRGWFCTKCSAGCANCYAEVINLRLGNGLEYAVRNLKEVDFRLVNLEAPLRWRKPYRVFVNSMTDLFHESVPDALIDQVFAVMALAPRQTFQVLTKRAKRMREYLSNLEKVAADWASNPKCLKKTFNATDVLNLRALKPIGRGGAPAAIGHSMWPLPNVHLGVSVEDQKAANERIPELLATPAAVLFLSCEPLLGPVNLLSVESTAWPQLKGRPALWDIDWVIVGGESGRKARPMCLDWARSLRDQCVTAKIPFLFKQWGAWAPFEAWRSGKHKLHSFCSDRGGPYAMQLVGKKRAGRLLDGREWNEMPSSPRLEVAA